MGREGTPNQLVAIGRHMRIHICGSLRNRYRDVWCVYNIITDMEYLG